MRNKLVLGFLILGVISVGILGVLVLLTQLPQIPEKQVPSEQVNLPTDTLVQPVEPDRPTPLSSATDTDEPSQLEPIIELIGSTEVVIPTNTSIPTHTIQPSSTATLLLTTESPSDTTLPPTQKSYCGSHPTGVMCTPPNCSSDERYICPKPCECPGRCGTMCGLVAPGDPSGFGRVPVNICYLSADLHEMTLYFKDARSGQLFEFPIVGDNVYNYTVYLPPGKYVGFAWLKDSDIGGAYTQYTICSPKPECTDHSLVPFTIYKQSASGIIKNL